MKKLILFFFLPIVWVLSQDYTIKELEAKIRILQQEYNDIVQMLHEYKKQQKILMVKQNKLSNYFFSKMKRKDIQSQLHGLLYQIDTLYLKKMYCKKKLKKTIQILESFYWKEIQDKIMKMQNRRDHRAYVIYICKKINIILKSLDNSMFEYYHKIRFRYILKKWRYSSKDTLGICYRKKNILWHVLEVSKQTQKILEQRRKLVLIRSGNLKKYSTIISLSSQGNDLQKCILGKLEKEKYDIKKNMIS